MTTERIVGGNGGEKTPNWPHGPFAEKEINPERYKVVKIRGIEVVEDPTRNNDYGRIARWMSDDKTRRHLRAPIPPIKNFADSEVMTEALKELDRYYLNKNRRDEEGKIIDDESEKITPIVAVNSLGEAIATLVIRWKGDPFEKEKEEIRKPNRIASIENIIVDPDLEDRHVGTQLMVAALDVVFYRKGYEGMTAKAVRLWIFNDKIAGEVGKKISFIRALGFETMGGDKGNWKEYAEKRGIPPDGRDGQQYELTKEKWEKMKREDAEKKEEERRLVLPSGIIDEESLRIPHASAENRV